ncbi:MAG: glycosyltransferase [bacterium]|nr:glycosyltransferase [bacterium]
MTKISRLVFFTKKNTGKAKSSDRIDTTSISVVIPVKDNQKGINQYLEYFFKTQIPEHYPKEIIIVDNDSVIPIEVEQRFRSNNLLIKVLDCKKPGPGAARNAGVKAAEGDWILFNDSDCLPTSSTVSGYLKSENGSVGYAGNVKSFGNDKLSAYYESQEILVPAKIYNNKGVFTPQYIITANALVWKKAFEDIGGFNETMDLAGGEDIDLGLRLSEIGDLSYCFESIVLHDFSDGWAGFRKRFIRYGRGNRIVARIWEADLTPRLFRANKKTLFNVVAAKLQFLFLAIGYFQERN